ncbi:MAG: hypothetical protein U5K54_23755 [Cytophagales bacterium]|nr:hypothetical protein [Cytophagales bacterium]
MAWAKVNWVMAQAHGYLHMAFIILIANGWGIYLKEWNGVSKKTRTTIILGIATDYTFSISSRIMETQLNSYKLQATSST